NSLPGNGVVKVAILGDDPLYSGRYAGLGNNDAVAGCHATGGNRAREAAKIKYWTADILHGKPEWQLHRRHVYAYGFQMAKQCRARVPWCTGRMFADIVAVTCGERDGCDRDAAKRIGKL